MTTEPETISHGTEYDEDVSKINVDGISQDDILKLLTETAEVWIDIDPKYKECSRNFLKIKKWMMVNDVKILVIPRGAVGLVMQKSRRVVVPDSMKESLRKNVITPMLRKLFTS